MQNVLKPVHYLTLSEEQKNTRYLGFLIDWEYSSFANEHLEQDLGGKGRNLNGKVSWPKGLYISDMKNMAYNTVDQHSPLEMSHKPEMQTTYAILHFLVAKFKK